MNSFGVICFGLVGLELASIMGDEIENPREEHARGRGLGRGPLRACCTSAQRSRCWLPCDKDSISVLQGIVQAVSHMAGQAECRRGLCRRSRFLLSLSIAGIGSAWLGGSARIPFVAGLDSYMPAWLGRDSSEIRDAVCGPDRARDGFTDPGDYQFSIDGRSAGIVSAAFVACRGAATDSLSIHVRRVVENCAGQRILCAVITAGRHSSWPADSGF